MLMADTMAIFFVILGLLLAFPALWLLCSGLWPHAVKRAHSYADQGIVKPLLIGLPLTMIGIVMVGILKNLPGAVGTIGAIIVGSTVALFANAGLAGLVASLGQKLAARTDEEIGWRVSLRGGIVLVLSFLLPVLGWFILLPASMMVGFGLAALSLFRRNELLATKQRHPPAITEALASKREYSTQ